MIEAKAAARPANFRKAKKEKRLILRNAYNMGGILFCSYNSRKTYSKKKKKKRERPSFQIICKIIYFVNIATKHYLNTKFSKYLQVLGQYESAKYLTSSRQGPS